MDRGNVIAGAVVLAAVVGVAAWLQFARSSDARRPPAATTGRAEGAPPPAAPNATVTRNGLHRITIRTSQGDIVFETYDADAPKAVGNFTTLAGRGFYDGVIFHRVIKGFMIQGGDPLGTGAGGPGYTFEDELNPTTESYRNGYRRGVVAMANAGPNTNGSQFFIMHQDYPLPNNYTIFGRVVEGQEVVDAIASVATGGNDKPLEPVVMERVTVASRP